MTEISPQHFTGPPEYYSDAVQVGVSPYGVTLSFGLQTNSPGDAKAVAVVRMSPQHALVMYQVLKSNLRAYEQQVGTIALPDRLFEEMGLEKEI